MLLCEKVREWCMPIRVRLDHVFNDRCATWHVPKQWSLPQEVARIKGEYLGSLEVRPAPTEQTMQLVVCPIGLTGSYRPSVMREVAKSWHATLVDANAVRGLLRGVEDGSKYLDVIMYYAIMHVVERGGNVVLDMDAVEARRRKVVRAAARRSGAVPLLVRFYCSIEVLLSRILLASANGDVHPFWLSEMSEVVMPVSDKPELRAAGLIFRTILEREHLHYEGVGRKKRKRPLPIDFSFDVDTTNETDPKVVADRLIVELNKF